MKSILATSALTLVLATSVVADASAWTRKSTTIGTYGNTVNRSVSGNCAGGTCSRDAAVRLIHKMTSKDSGSTSCAGGTCPHSGATTNAYGNTVTRNGAVSCYGGTCSQSSTTTGAYGRSVTHQGTVTVQP